MFSTVRMAGMEGGDMTTMDSAAGLSTPSAEDIHQLLVEYNGEIRSAAMPGIVFVSLLCFLGFFGNILVLYVFTFRYKTCNFRYFVLCLCITDLSSSLTTMPGEVVTQMYWYMYPNTMICKVKSFFNVFTVCAEAFCLLIISVDRYRKVCRPHGWQIKPKIAIGLCGLVYVAAFILAFPVAIFWGTHTEVHSYRDTNITVTKCEKDQQYVHSKQPVHYTVSVQTCVSGSLVVMLALYILVARTLLKNKTTNQSALKRMPKPSEKCATISNPNLLSPYSGKADITRSERSDHESGYSTYVDTELGHESTTRDTDGGTDVGTDVGTTDELTNSDIGTTEDRKSDKKRQGQRNRRTQHRSRKSRNMASRIQRKTRITFILSIVFIITTIMYFTLLDLIATNILGTLTPVEKAVYFIFFRLVFINHVINPIVYGVLDPHFRKEMKRLASRFVNCCFCCRRAS